MSKVKFYKTDAGSTPKTEDGVISIDTKYRKIYFGDGNEAHEIGAGNFQRAINILVKMKNGAPETDTEGNYIPDASGSPLCTQFNNEGYIYLTDNDFDNLTTPGTYVVSTPVAKTMTNSPFKNAFVIEVFGSNKTTTAVIQRATIYGVNTNFAQRTLNTSNSKVWRYYLYPYGTLNEDGEVDYSAMSDTVISQLGLAKETHTHTTSLASNTGTATVTLAHGSTYKLTAGGTSVIFKMPSDNNTNYYHTTGTWSSLTYTAKANGGAGELKFTIPTGTTASTVALGNHKHTTTIATSTGTNELTLAHGGKYAITAGGDSFIFTMPSDNNTDTKVTQAYDATTNASIPLLFSATSGVTSTSSRGATTAKLNNKFYVNPSNGILTATAFGLANGAGILNTKPADTSSTGVLQLKSPSTLYLNRGASTSLIFAQNNTAHASFDTDCNFIPSATDTYSLGDSDSKWKGVYATSVSADTASIKSIKKVNYTASINTAGWYRIFTASNSNSTGRNSVMFSLGRSYNSPKNEEYTFVVSIGYDGDVQVTQLSGFIGGHLIDKIRVLYDNGQVSYIEFHTGIGSNGANTYYLSGCIGDGTFQDPVITSSIPSGYTAVEIATGTGILSNGTAVSLSNHTHGNITTAGKLGTASRVVVTDGSKNITVSSNITTTELGYLDGVTSAIQTQLNNKLPLSGGTMTGKITMPSNQYFSDVSGSEGKCGIDMNNSDIIGANSIVFKDDLSSRGEGFMFKRSNSSKYDQLYVLDGQIYLKPNISHIPADSTDTAWSGLTTNKVYHSGNLTFSMSGAGVLTITKS